MNCRFAMLSCLSLLLACDGQDDFAFFDESVWRHAIACDQHGALNSGADVTDLIPVSDSAFAALYADARELITYDRSFNPRHRLHYDIAGPRGVRHAVSAAVSDTTLFIADEAAGAIKQFDRAGDDRGTVPLTFIPRRIRLGGNRLLITPLVAGTRPGDLLFAVSGQKVEALGGPIAQYSDIGINTLANMASLAAFPKRVVLLHELVVPFGYVFDLDRARQFSRFAVPIPGAVRDRVERLPKPPLTEKNVNELTVVAFVAAANVANGHTYYVTRVGDGRARPYRKLLVQLDSAMRLRAVHPIDVNPHHMVYVNNPPALVAVDAQSNWFECKLP